MRRVRRFVGYCLCGLFGAATLAGGAVPAPVEIVSPVTDPQGHIMEAVAPDGKTYPVFRPTPPSPLVDALRGILSSGQAQQELALERCARTLARQSASAAIRSSQAAPLPPMYLLLSNEEGGFARYGFWLEKTQGQRELVMAGYVDMVVSQGSVDFGGFEEIFCHELGHLILRSLLGDLSHGPSRKMHQSMTVTDYPTAFDEGYGEHFQPLVRDSTTNPILRKIQAGTLTMDMDMLWLSDGQLRTDGVKRNLFVHRKALPDAGNEADPYRRFLEAETSTEFKPGRLRNAQEMMASEGVIATLFYRLVNRDSLRNQYRDAAFYNQFVEGNAGAIVSPSQAISPYENVNLKLFAAMHQIAPRAADPGCPLAIALISAYSQLFPEEAKSAYGVFLDTTYGATVSPEVAALLERAAVARRVGDLDGYSQNFHAAFLQLDQITDRVVKGELALDANLGPEIWLLNEDFKIAPTLWEKDRTLPLTINLNTASEAEFMTLPGVDQALAARLVSSRDARGYFRSVDEVGTVDGVSANLLQTMKDMAERMKRAGTYARQ